MGVDSIEPGLDFVSILEEWVTSCDVLLALIGPRWLESADQDGQLRLQDPNDFVRIEIRSALEHGQRVILVLVDDAKMPRADQLPEDLRALGRRNAALLSHDRFGADVGKLIASVRKAIAQEAEHCRREAERRRAEEEAERKRAEEAEAARKLAKEKEERKRAEADEARRKAEEEERQRAEAEAKGAEDKAAACRRTDEESQRQQAAEKAAPKEPPGRRTSGVSAESGHAASEPVADPGAGSGKSFASRLRGWMKVAVPGVGIAVLVAVLVTNQMGEHSRVEVVPSYPEMVVIPAGTFQIGSPASPDDETPPHKVRIESFAIGKTEVTFDQWDTCVRACGCKHRADDKGWGRGDRPVVNVSWEDAQEYAAWLSHRETGKRYRLPTEAEWEYAARAGTDTRWFFGDSDRDLGKHAWYDGNFGGKTHPVGEKTPNPWGLRDVHGNVWEWVQACWNDDYEGAPADGSVWEQGLCGRRVLRGGSWDCRPEGLRSADRYGGNAGYRSSSIGFRLAQVI